MSIRTEIPDPEKMSKKSHHRKNDSEEELDVFEAAKYFSGANEMYTNSGQIKVGKDHHLQEKLQVAASRAAGRLSLDMPMRHSLIAASGQNLVEKKKHKQPSSPGGKLAHFLNSLFNQTSSKKKKSKSVTTTQSEKIHEDQSPGWRRKRRSSISHFRTTNSGLESNSRPVYLAHSGSGFRTPPPYSYTPTKSYKDLSSKPQGNLINNVKPAPDRKLNLDYAWLDEKFRFAGTQDRKNGNRGVAEKIEGKNCPRFINDGDDDGGDSDSSSDLFELSNYDLDFCSSGLPVYETTNMDSIKRSTAPITSVAAAR